MSTPDLPRFFIPDAKIGTSTWLSEEEFRHAKVIRCQTGDSVHIVTGQGVLIDAEITLEKRKAKVTPRKEVISESRSQAGLTLAVAPTKNIARFEWVVEKATELNVAVITPVLCENSERKNINVDRLNKIIISASKQSKRLWFPVIEEMQPFAAVLASEAKTNLIAHCQDSEKSQAIKELRSAESKLILIGPEGDFSRTEVDQAIDSGFKAISLGQSRLRTETAAITACAISYLAQH